MTSPRTVLPPTRAPKSSTHSRSSPPWHRELDDRGTREARLEVPSRITGTVIAGKGD